MRDIKVINDAFVYADDNSHFPYFGLDGYSDMSNILNGHNIEDCLKEQLELRGNVRRCFVAVDSFAKMHPKEDGRIYDLLPQYLDYLDSYGIRAELTHGDLQIVLPSEEDQYAHLMKLFAAAGDRNYFLEFNENEKNGINHRAVYRAYLQKPAKVIMSLGSSLSGGECPVYEDKIFDYAGQHLRRDIGAGMYADTVIVFQQAGYRRSDGTVFRGVGNIPVPLNEIIKAGSQCKDTNVYFKIFRMASCWNGATFHSDLGILSQPLKNDPIQRACAEAASSGAF